MTTPVPISPEEQEDLREAFAKIGKRCNHQTNGVSEMCKTGCIVGFKGLHHIVNLLTLLALCPFVFVFSVFQLFYLHTIMYLFK